MTSNNETVSHQMPWAGNIGKTVTSNRKQFTVTHEMLTAVACDRWNLSAVFKFCFCFVLLYNKSLNDWSLGEQWVLFPSGNKIHCSPRDQSLSVKCFIGISKHREESWKFDIQRSIFDKIRGVWIADETLSQVFDISSNQNKNEMVNRRVNLSKSIVIMMGYPNLRHARDFLCFNVMNY